MQGGPVKWVYNIWCIFSGIVFCASGYTLFSSFQSGLSIAMWALLATYGFGCEILSGIFPLKQNRVDGSLATKIHGAGSAIGFTCLLFVPLLLGLSALSVNAVLLGIISLMFFALAFLFFCLFVMGEKDRFKNTVMRYGGLWQRLVLLACYLPLLYFSIGELYFF